MKKTLSMLLAGTMLASTIPMVSAANEDPTTLKELMAGKNISVPYETSVKVPADIEVRQNGDTEYVDGPIEIKQKKEEELPSFDYEATLYMGVVKETFDNYIAKANALIEANGGSNKDALKAELENIIVTGHFTVTIKNADEMIIPDAIKVNDQSLNGFNDETKLTYKEVSRDYKDNTMTIEIDVQEDMTKAELATKLGENLILACDGVGIDAMGEYELIGEITGYTNIGDDPATDEDESIAKITYKAVQEGDETAKINAIVSVEEDNSNKRPTSGGGGSNVPKDEIDIDFVIDGTPVKVNTDEVMSVNVPESSKTVVSGGLQLKTNEFKAIIPADRIFEGWFLDAEYTIKAEDNMKITKDTTFYGKTKKYGGSDVLDMDNHYAYIIGYPDGFVRPEQNISREEVATIFFRLLTEEARNSLLKKTNDFSDVESVRWSNNAISTMANYGTIVGYNDGTFKPGKDITRAEFVAMTARFYDLEEAESTFTDVSGHWAEKYIASAAAKGWINGYEDGTFKPDKYITRAEAMTIVNHLLNRKVDAEGLHADAVQWDDNTSDKWYYYEVLEATNSHKCADRLEGVVVEKWTECLENYDWSILEK